MFSRGFKRQFNIFGEYPPLRFCRVRTLLFIPTPAIKPVTVSFNRGKGMIAGAKNRAGPNLLEIYSLMRRFFIEHLFRHLDMRNINAFSFLVVQPFGNSHENRLPGLDIIILVLPFWNAHHRKFDKQGNASTERVLLSPSFLTKYSKNDEIISH